MRLKFLELELQLQIPRAECIKSYRDKHQIDDFFKEV
jgi:hypothetical protein